jgi:hypothetical protein
MRPERFHAGLDQLWSALGELLPEHCDDVFDFASKEITRLRAEVAELSEQLERAKEFAVDLGGDYNKVCAEVAELQAECRRLNDGWGDANRRALESAIKLKTMQANPYGPPGVPVITEDMWSKELPHKEGLYAWWRPGPGCAPSVQMTYIFLGGEWGPLAEVYT